jgi:hypothetical protein
VIGCVRCPKCRADVAESDPECPHCGIIFAKYLERETALPPHTPPLPTADAEEGRSSLSTLLLGVESPTPMPAAIGRGVFLLLMAFWTTTLASRAVNVLGSNSFIHMPNLVFHEAGHILFIPLGRFMTILGGSLTQVLVPLVCAGAFLWQTRDAFGAAIAVWWAGQNLTDVATYINDARALQLVLIGGKTGAEVEGHDWEYLLNAMGQSHHDHAIALVVQTIGTWIMVGALIWAAIVVVNQISALRLAQR